MSATGGDVILTAEGLTKAFGGLVAVNAFDMAVNRQEIVGLIGPNGAGKTTLFALISGFLKPDRGRVRFRGEDITLLRPYKIARRGLVRTFQVVQPFPAITTLENVMVGSFTRERPPERARRRPSPSSSVSASGQRQTPSPAESTSPSASDSRSPARSRHARSCCCWTR